MILEIKYKDIRNWQSVTGTVTNWTNYAKKLKSERVIPHFVAPVKTQDTWNGKQFDVQITLHDSFSFDFYIKESEINDLQKIAACSDIIISEYIQGPISILNKSYILDLTTSDLITISEPEKISNTSTFKVNVIFRTNRTIINKTSPVLNTNYIQVYTTSAIKTYTDFEIIDWQKDNQDILIDWFDGSKKKIQSTEQSGKQILLYLNSADAKTFISNLKKSTATNINGTSITEIEFENIEIAQDLHKIIVKGVTASTITTFNPTISNTYNLRIVNEVPTTYNFYTDYAPEFSPEAPILNSVSKGDGINESTFNISKTLKRVKFFLTQSDAFELKKRFELGGTMTIDSVPILESRAVSPSKISVNLYEVDIDCLLSTDYKY